MCIINVFYRNRQHQQYVLKYPVTSDLLSMTSATNISHVIEWSTGSSRYNVSGDLYDGLDLTSGIVYVIVTSSVGISAIKSADFH